MKHKYTNVLTGGKIVTVMITGGIYILCTPIICTGEPYYKCNGVGLVGVYKLFCWVIVGWFFHWREEEFFQTSSLVSLCSPPPSRLCASPVEAVKHITLTHKQCSFSYCSYIQDEVSYRVFVCRDITRDNVVELALRAASPRCEGINSRSK